MQTSWNAAFCNSRRKLPMGTRSSLHIVFFFKQTGQPIANILHNQPVLPGVCRSRFGCLDRRMRAGAAAHEALPRRCGGSPDVDPGIQSRCKGPALNVGSNIFIFFWETNAWGDPSIIESKYNKVPMQPTHYEGWDYPQISPVFNFGIGWCLTRWLLVGTI